jgi:hypothetical protein
MCLQVTPFQRLGGKYLKTGMFTRNHKETEELSLFFRGFAHKVVQVIVSESGAIFVERALIKHFFLVPPFPAPLG